MDMPFPIHEIATLTDERLQCSLRNEKIYLTYRHTIQRCFRSSGLTKVQEYTFSEPTARHAYLLVANDGQRDAAICLPSAAEAPMMLRALNTAECDACDALLPECNIYYASFFADPVQKKLLLVGPVPVRHANEWLTNNEQNAQFLPPEMHGEDTQLSPLLGGAALFKMQNLLIPHVLTHGTLPRFSVRGLFEDREQGCARFYVLLGGTAPTHMMLVRRNDDSRNLEFVRPFFFYGDAPDSTLAFLQEAVMADAPEAGLIELASTAGTNLYAECVESVLFPGVLPVGKRLQWTLSLVAESCCILQHHTPNLTNSLRQQASKDFRREHGCESPNDFAFALPPSSDPPALCQETLTARTTFTARVLSCTSECVDGVPAQHWRVQLLPKAENLTLHVFAGAELACFPVAGDVVRLCGILHSSPDAIIAEASEPSSAPPPEPQTKPEQLTEETACRLLCNAVCTHEWDDFIANSCEDLTYTSHMNGTHLNTRQEFIRYMSERRQLWRHQRSFQGMCWDTGNIIYRGVQKPCYMLSCFGQMVGASTLTLRNGRISAIETLPKEANASFLPDEECRVEPLIFHPFRGHLCPHPAEHTPLQLYAANYLRECMIKKTGYCAPNAEESATKRDCARWIKLTRDEPTCCDMAFSYRGRVYAVCTAEVTKHPDHGGSVAEEVEALADHERLLSLAEQYGLIPCFFPAERQYSPQPEQTWNLWDMRNMQPLFPDETAATDAIPPPSAWEILLGALAELQVRVRQAGGTVIAYHDTPQLFPHFWYRDAHGKLCWVILRCTADPAKQDSSLAETELLPQRLAQGTNGYLATATAYGNAECSKPARRGEPMYIKLSTLMPLSC